MSRTLRKSDFPTGKWCLLRRAMYASVRARVNAMRPSLRTQCHALAQVIHRVVNSCQRSIATEQNEHIEDPSAHCEPRERNAQWLKQLSRADATSLRITSQRIFDLLRLPSVYRREGVAHARQ